MLINENDSVQLLKGRSVRIETTYTLVGGSTVTDNSECMLSAAITPKSIWVIARKQVQKAFIEGLEIFDGETYNYYAPSQLIKSTTTITKCE